MKSLKKMIRTMSMRRKMLFFYVLPVFVISLCVLRIAMPGINQKYEEKEKKGIEHACTQAVNSLSHYLYNMYYFSIILSENTGIKEVLQTCSFSQRETMMQKYQEFYELNQAFEKIILFNPNYEIGMYVPDDSFLSVNYAYFYPESELLAREDYEDLMETVQSGKVYLSILEEKKGQRKTGDLEYLALFNQIQVQREDGENAAYVTKVKLPYESLQSILGDVRQMDHEVSYFTDTQDRLLAVNGTEGDGMPLAQSDPWAEVKFQGTAYYTYAQSVESFGTIHLLIKKSELRERSRETSYLILGMVLCIVACAVCCSYIITGYYGKKLKRLQDNMEEVARGNITAAIAQKTGDGDEFDHIFVRFSEMADRLMKLMKEQYRLGKKVMAAELKTLQAQINPHFLYNTLDLINWEALSAGADEAAEIAANLGKYYRYTLNHGKNVLKIREEVEHVKTFVDIENMHYDQAIALDVQVPEEIREYACLNILLQPFVENAILHGIGEREDIKTCRIEIRARQEGSSLYFTILDDGPGIPEEKLGQIADISGRYESGYGVRNVNFRIKLCYGEAYGVTYERNRPRGTAVEIHIPAMQSEELEKLIQ